MFVFSLIIMSYNSLTPRLRLPFNSVRGTVQQRRQKAALCVDKFYRDFSPKYNKRGVVSFDEIQKSVDAVFEHKLNVHVIQKPQTDEYGGQDVAISDYSGKLSALTLELDKFKHNRLRFMDLITVIHEFQHVADQFFHPKFLARYQYMSSEGLYTPKYDNLYDNFLYKYESPRGKRHKAKILKTIKYKIKKFLRGMPVEDKINYIQDARYFLMSEDNAYRIQYKYAKKLEKKHINVLSEDLEKQNQQFMFKEKINLLTQLGFEIIQKERRKMAKMPKIKMYEDL